MSDVFDLPMIRVTPKKRPAVAPRLRERKVTLEEMFPHRALNSRYFAASNAIEANGSISWWEWLICLFMKEN